MDYRPCPELCGGYAAMRIPTATTGGHWATRVPTATLRNGGDLEVAARIAGHESTRTTQLYNRVQDEISLDEIERIHI